MSKWLRKTLPLTVDMRPADRYAGAWQADPVPEWLASQPSLLQAHCQTDRGDMLTPYNTQYVADGKGLSAYGGMSLFIAFTQKLGLGAALRRHLRFAKRRSDYSPTQLGECLVDAIACGISRIENTNLLRDDPLLAAARGLTTFPDHATVHRYISAFTRPHVAQLQKVAETLFGQANRPAKRTRVTLDFDATDAVVYGQQEEAAFGHKNARAGHREYQIETCFLGSSRDVVHHQVRAGNVNSGPGFPVFVEESLARLSAEMVVWLLRADAAYFSVENVRALDEKPFGYLVGCTAYKFLLDKAYAQACWQRISPEEEVCSIQHAFRDGVSRRVLIARHPDPKQTRPKQNGQPALLEVSACAREGYKHFACVVSDRLAHLSNNRLWQSYAGRSNLENAIKESKLGFGLEALPSKRFAANQAYAGFVFLAYNLVNWFKRYAFGDDPLGHRQIKAVRQWVLCVPALIERAADHWRVRLPEGHPSLPLFARIQAFLAQGKPVVT